MDFSVIEFLQGPSGYAELFNYFFSIGFWFGLLMVVPLLLILLVNRS